jgi:hypothetical protein
MATGGAETDKNFGGFMKASVKIMLSYDYNHFEIALSSDDEMISDEVNSLRKTAQRLADEAVRQYKVAKKEAGKKANSAYERQVFLNRIERITEKPEGERTVNEMALLKQYQDENWEEQFNQDYDYDDDYAKDEA